jgi:exodeoxyribonuclease-3
MKIISWNVNGIRAAYKKGMIDFLTLSNADVFCVQETKANIDQLQEAIYSPAGYKSWWNSAERKGYSGTAFYSKTEPDNVENLGIEEFDSEGRMQIIYFGNLVLLNGYFPNSQAEGARLDYKLAFNNAVKEKADFLVNDGKTVIVLGDFNVSHKPIDLARPESNEKNPGYLPEERSWMDSFIDSGWTDTFRMFEKEGGHYTWWSYRTNARARNIGWRLDYFCINSSVSDKVEYSKILPEITGSDHCPIEMQLKL